MKSLFMRTIHFLAGVFALSVFTLGARAQNSGDPPFVPIKVWATVSPDAGEQPIVPEGFISPGTVGTSSIGISLPIVSNSITTPAEPLGSFQNSSVSSTTISSNGALILPVSTLQIEPDHAYTTTATVTVISKFPQAASGIDPGNSPWSGNLQYNFVAPPGYEVLVNMVPTPQLTSPLYFSSGAGSLAVTFELYVTHPNSQVLNAGVCSSIKSGEVFWKVSLGALSNGQSAGYLTLRDPGTESDWSNLFTPGALSYISSSGAEAQVTYGSPQSGGTFIGGYAPDGTPDQVPIDINGPIQQILADQTSVNIVVLPNGQPGYTIQFFQASASTNPNSIAKPQGFTGTPFMQYTVQPGPQNASGTPSLQITKQTYNAGTLVATWVTTLTRSGTAPNFIWSLQDWAQQGATAFLTENRAWTQSGSQVNEVLTRSGPNGTSLVLNNIYSDLGWGLTLTQSVAGQNASPQLVSNYTYYEDNVNHPESYGFLELVGNNDGSWQGFDYYGTQGQDIYASGIGTGTPLAVCEYGMLNRTYQPFGSAPAYAAVQAGLSPTQGGVVTAYSYQPDNFGAPTRTNSISTTINGAPAGSSTTTYNNSLRTDANGNVIAQAVSTVQTDGTAGDTLATTTNYYREDVSSAFLCGQPTSVINPDGTEDSYAYLYSNTAPAIAIVRGTSLSSQTVFGSAVNNTVCSSVTVNNNSVPIDQIFLVSGKSTMDVTIRDGQSLVREAQKWAWIGGSWIMVADIQYGYDGQAAGLPSTKGLLTYGNLTSTFDTFNSASTSSAYSGDVKTSDTDSTGIVVNYTIDGFGRVATAAKVGGTTQTFTYDASNRLTNKSVGPEGANWTQTYDDAGRLASSSSPGIGSTNLAYSYGSGTTVTATNPDGSTRIESAGIDGKPVSVTGTAVVGQYYAYTFGASGMDTRVYVGASNSSRYADTISDWIGRTQSVTAPGFQNGFTITKNSYYAPATGQLVSTTTNSGAPANCYQYDGLGRVCRSGLDVANEDNAHQGILDINSLDRITDDDVSYATDVAGNVWLQETTSIYPTAQPVVASIKSVRLTGFASGQFAETKTTDVYGNLTDSVTTVNPTNTTVTTTTTSAAFTSSSISTSVNGLQISSQGFDGLTSSITYDSMERPYQFTDTRGQTTTKIYYAGTYLPGSVTDPSGSRTYSQFDAMGRPICVTDPLGNTHYTGYDSEGRVVYQWGSGSQPISFGYDIYGEKTQMTTYRGGSGWTGSQWPAGADGSGDTTAWNFDPYTGLLTSKTDANQHTVSIGYTFAINGNFNYNGTQQPALTVTRTLPRSATSSATKTDVFDGLGELLSSARSINGSTPSPYVQYAAYTRLGQPLTVVDATGSRTFTYDGTNPTQLDSELLDSTNTGIYNSRLITYLHDSGSLGSSTNSTFGALSNYPGRPAGFEIGVAGNPGRDLVQNSYTSNLGLPAGVLATNGSSASRPFVYSTLNGITQTELVYGYTSGSFNAAFSYDPNRPILTGSNSSWGGSTLTGFQYGIDAMGRKASSTQSGSAYADYTANAVGYSSVTNNYAYDSYGRLQSANLVSGKGVSLPGREFEYRYDNAGNRASAGETGSVSNGDNQYVADPANEYTTVENNTVRLLGFANPGTTVAVLGVAASNVAQTDNCFGADLLPNNYNPNSPVQGSFNVTATIPGNPNQVASLSDTFSIPAQTQVLTYDWSGNLTNDGVWSYSYDVENRLVEMTNLQSGLDLKFDYDYLGRRFAKVVTAGPTATTHLFIYAGEELIAETNPAGAITRSYTWGTAGPSALLELTNFNYTGTTLTGTTDYLAGTDGNQNVAVLINAATTTLPPGSVAAAYEYGPFGEPLRKQAADPTVADNPFRFATNYTDVETGLVDFGRRFYSPTWGRFINRDPIEEAGGANLYGYCDNDAINRVDYLGDSWLSKLWDHTVLSVFQHIGKAISSLQRWTNAHPIVANLLLTGGFPIVGQTDAHIIWHAAQRNPQIAAVVAAIATWYIGGLGAAAIYPAITATETAVVAGAASGFVGGFVGARASGASLDDSFSAGLRGAAGGAIMGGVAGYYGNTWNLGRVGVTAFAGGAASEIEGGSFERGAEISGGFAFITDIAYNMRAAEVANSRIDPNNASGKSVGFFGDAFKLGGGRIDPRLSLALQVPSPLGGVQGGQGYIFGMQYSSGSIADHLVEAYAGVHDFLNSFWSYNGNGDWAPAGSVIGQHLGSYAVTMSNIMNAVDVPLATPIVAGSVVGINPEVEEAIINTKRQ